MAEPHEPAPSTAPARRRDPARVWTLSVLGALLLTFAWSLLADRSTPYSADASVRAFVVRVATEVPGRIIEVGVRENQAVAAGTVLFRLDPEPFDIAVRRAEAQLAAAGQSVGASTSAVDAAQAQVAEAIARRDNIRDQAARTLELVRRGVYPPARGDTARAQVESSAAEVTRAEANLEQARRALGPSGEDNPAIRMALAQLQQVRLDRTRTVLVAPTDGVVTNLSLDQGQFVPAGQPVLSFLDARAIWIVAPLRENSLGNIRPGTRAEVVLDALPGHVLAARVDSIGWGVADAQVDPATGLTIAPSKNEVLPSARRFPVQLTLEHAPPQGSVRYGARADVVIYAGTNPVLAGLAWAWIRLVSILTYVY